MVSEQDLIDAGMNPNAGGGVYGPGGDTSIYVEDEPTEAPPDIPDPSDNDPASGGGGGGSDPSPPPAPAPEPDPEPITEPQPDPVVPQAPAPEPQPDLENTVNGPDMGGETNGGGGLLDIAAGRGEGGPGLLIAFAAVVFGAIVLEGVMN